MEDVEKTQAEYLRMCKFNIEGASSSSFFFWLFITLLSTNVKNSSSSLQNKQNSHKGAVSTRGKCIS